MYGYHPVKAALLNPKRIIHRLIVTQNAANRLTKEIGSIDHLKPEFQTSKYFNELLGADATHQGFAIELSPLVEENLDSLDLVNNPDQPIVLLDQVTDPHNVGAILRSVEAFSGKAIITTSRNAPGETGVLAKTSSGAIEHIPIIKVTNLTVAMARLKEKGYWLIGLDPQGENELETVLTNTNDVQIGFVMGAEGKGLRDSVKKKCDYLAQITINNSINSLNVAIATSICLYAASCIRTH